MTITQLEYILAVDKYKTFGKAAEACFVTQPTLSVQIQKFEDDLGVVIFDRTKSPILVTEEGLAVIEQAKVILRESKKLKHVVKEIKNKLAGTLKIAVIPTLSPYIIPIFAKSFSEKYPEVTLIIEETKTEDIIKQLANDEIDAGLLVTPLHNKNLIEKILYYEQFYLFVSESHKLFKSKQVKQEDLELSDIWLLNKGNCFRDQVLNICSESASSAKDKIKFESGNFETLKNMVIKSDGYTILPHMAVEQLSEDFKLNVRPFSSPIPTREVSLVYSRSFYKKRLLDILESEIKSNIPNSTIQSNSNEIKIVEFVN